MILKRGLIDQPHKTATRLVIGTVEIVFHDSKPIVIYDGEVFFSDTKHNRGAVHIIAGFHPDVPHTRVPAADFNWYVSSAMMRQLRTLLRRTDDITAAADPQT